MIEPEEEANIVAAHLQQRHFIMSAGGERWARLGIESQEGLLHEELHSPFGLSLADNYFDAPRKECPRQLPEERLIKFIVYLFQFSVDKSMLNVQ